jgi:hypothetical protein
MLTQVSPRVPQARLPWKKLMPLDGFLSHEKTSLKNRETFHSPLDR